jgi:hypothetical protein
MKITAAEKAEVRRHWGYLKLRFKKDGSVEGQQHPGGSWGLLYSPEDLKRHVESIRKAKERLAKQQKGW